MYLGEKGWMGRLKKMTPVNAPAMHRNEENTVNAPRFKFAMKTSKYVTDQQ